MNNGYDDEPEEPRDENDPAYREELFAMFRDTDTRPEEIVTDPVMRKEYAAWLIQHPAEAE